MVGVALAGRSRRRWTEPQRVREAPDRIFTEFGRLAQELAHEVRNPLTAINARLYKLQKKLPAGTAEHRDAVIIENEIKRLDQMLESFRKLGWHAAPQAVPVKADALLREVRDLFAAQLEPQSIELRCEPVPGLEFHGDPQQLMQVLVNLVKNAAESILQANQPSVPATGRPTPADGVRRQGTICVRIYSVVERPHHECGDAVVLEVQDNGPGIPDEVRERLLEPFFSTKEDGTGLGLPIAARIVAQHRGKLEFESHPDQGTIFRVLLPDSP